MYSGNNSNHKCDPKVELCQLILRSLLEKNTPVTVTHNKNSFEMGVSPVARMIYCSGNAIGIVARETEGVILLKSLIGSNTESKTGTRNQCINIIIVFTRPY